MHELPFAKSIFKSVIASAEENRAKAVTKVTLEVGVLRDFIPEIVQKYWNYVSRDSIAEGSVIEMHEIPATASCGRCGTVYPFTLRELQNCHCPQCGCDTGSLVTGRELRIVDIEIVEG